MKRTKFNPKQLIVLSVIIIALSSCLGQTELSNSGFAVISTNSEYSAGYTMENGKLKELIPVQETPTFTYKLTGTYPVNSLILDQRKKDRTTNWNYKFGNQFPLLTAQPDNPTLRVLPLDNENIYFIYSEPTTPAFYNELCADFWNEPVTNGEMSKCWKLLRFTGVWGNRSGKPSPNASYEDDMIKFSAFDNKVSYKPGVDRSPEFNKIVSPSKKEVFATFTVGSELIPDNEYTENPTIDTYVKKGNNADYVNIAYDNGTDKYSIKFYKLSYSSNDASNAVIVVYIVSTNDVSAVELLSSVPDNTYAIY